jgi:hypothetical protein
MLLATVNQSVDPIREVSKTNMVKRTRVQEQQHNVVQLLALLLVLANRTQSIDILNHADSGFFVFYGGRLARLSNNLF